MQMREPARERVWGVKSKSVDCVDVRRGAPTRKTREEKRRGKRVLERRGNFVVRDFGAKFGMKLASIGD